MMDPTTIMRLSQQWGIDSYTIIREYLQIRFLEAWYRKVKPGSCFFKGGTMLRLVFGSNRFSEDLDFTTSLPTSDTRALLGAVGKTLNVEFPDLVVKDVKTIQGYSVRLLFPGPSRQHPLSIKLDFSVRESVLDPQVSPLTIRLPVPDIIIVEHLSKTEVLAEKIRALLHRKKGRDLYDLMYLLQTNTHLSLSFLNKKLSYYKEAFEPIALRQNVLSWEEKDLYQDLAKFLPVHDRRTISNLKSMALDVLAREKLISFPAPMAL